MNRPTKERLKRILAVHADCAEDELCEVNPLLAEISALQAIVTRVEALPEKWRGEYEACGHADELDDALRGEP